MTIFQPTLPARGATTCFIADVSRLDDFNPRSPHGERRLTHRLRRVVLAISTHAPRTGSDLNSSAVMPETVAFQPTLPARGATRRCS